MFSHILYLVSFLQALFTPISTAQDSDNAPQAMVQATGRSGENPSRIFNFNRAASNIKSTWGAAEGLESSTEVDPFQRAVFRCGLWPRAPVRCCGAITEKISTRGELS